MKILWVLALALGLGAAASAQEQKTTFYGYINGYTEKSQDQPQLSGTGGTFTRSDDKAVTEYSARDIHFVMQSALNNRFKTFLNLKAPEAEGVEVSNAWVEAKLMEDYLMFRIGKFYRPFEIYNEILDAVPTYIGIEPPELFDGDHLLLTRTTNLMLHGMTQAGPGMIRYSFTTGNDERKSDEFPFGLDVRYIQDAKWLFGASFYTTGGDGVSSASAPTATGGTNSPNGGILPWMEADQYMAYGVFGQFQDDRWTVQLSYFLSPHKGRRSDNAVTNLCTGAPLNRRQYERFGCGTGTNNLVAEYTIRTWYARIGYTLRSDDVGEFTPYVQYDNYLNEETVQSKKFGGDNEAGGDDEGLIRKWTAGLVYRPLPPVAIKADYSLHEQDMLGKSADYGEVRFSFSYYWRM